MKNNRAFHEQQAAIARDLYVKGFSADTSRADWQDAKDLAQKQILGTLTATNNLTAIAQALESSGRFTSVLRRLLAPPMSQDQFALLCPEYSKVRENRGAKVSTTDAACIDRVVVEWRDKALTPWLHENRPPATAEIERLATALVPLIASQLVGTVRRNKLSAKQEADVIGLLQSMGWQQKSVALVSQSAQLAKKEFAHKTRFATKNRPQEVDIACGLGGAFVIAMECKVTNDETNSIKRINDVLKKAQAWRDHWGSFVQTAALLQGVVASRDVSRLLDAGVEVFWSHRLADFREWLSEKV